MVCKPWLLAVFVKKGLLETAMLTVICTVYCLWLCSHNGRIENLQPRPGWKYLLSNLLQKKFSTLGLDI